MAKFVERESRKNDPERTKEDILNVASRGVPLAFAWAAESDSIAEKTRTSKRMIYYYFGSKEGLYLRSPRKGVSQDPRTRSRS